MIEPHSREMPNWAETAAAVLLSVAGLGTAWASFQASIWGGDQVSQYSEANARLTKASRLDIVAGQTAAVDTALFVAWMTAAQGGLDDRARFLEQRFSEPFARAFAEWRRLLPDDAGAYAMPRDAAQERVPLAVYPQSREAEVLRAEAAAAFRRGDVANRNSNWYVAVTVLFSTVLFLGGISQLMRRLRPRKSMLGLAALLCIGALVWLSLLPVEWL